MKKLPPEAKRGRATDRGREGDGNRSAAEIDCPQDSPKGERSVVKVIWIKLHYEPNARV